MTNIFNNPYYTGALNNYISQYFISNPTTSSQWKNVTGGIAYTGGSAAIGSNDATNAKLYVAGKTIV